MKVLVLGASGMLGNVVYSHLSNSGHNVIGTSRKRYTFLDDEMNLFDAYEDGVDQLPFMVDYVINCIGVTNRFINDNVARSVYINSVFPHELANWCKECDIKMIHITTDCVYSGKVGYYCETDFHDVNDLYGKTKSLGEPFNSMVLRTSIIGEEMHQFVNLISWLRSMNDQEITGYPNHLWNGITTKCYAKICEQIINEGRYEEGLFHIFSHEDITKHDLLVMLCDIYKLNIKIKKSDCVMGHINRTLRSDKRLVLELDIPPLYDQF